MPKKTVYTKITPLPSQIPRQLALDMLHSHGEIIELNPLVTGYTPIKAPKDATADEYFAQWYEINEKINFGLGMNKKISFKGVFHDMPWGLQTHTYIPLGIDLRNKWQVRGSQPGEPAEPRELGLETPSNGLYLREDVEIVANVALTSFVKKEMKAAAQAMVERLVRKAELLDEGRLQALFEQGRLKTSNPNVRTDNRGAILSPSVGTIDSLPSPGMGPGGSPPGSPRLQHGSFSQPPPNPDSSSLLKPKYGNYYDVALDRQQSQQQTPLRTSFSSSRPSESNSIPQNHHNYSHQQTPSYSKPYEPHLQFGPVEMEGSYYHATQDAQQNQPYANQKQPYTQPPNQAEPSFRSELPGDLILEPKTQHTEQQQYSQASYSQLHSSQQQPQHQQQQQAYPGAAPSASASSSTTHPSPNPDTTRTSSIGSSRYTPTTEYSAYSPYHSTQQQGQPQQGYGRDSSLVPDPLKFSSPSSKCPVCNIFEGDERAVQHHVGTHFEQNLDQRAGGK